MLVRNFEWCVIVRSRGQKQAGGRISRFCDFRSIYHENRQSYGNDALYHFCRELKGLSIGGVQKFEILKFEAYFSDFRQNFRDKNLTQIGPKIKNPKFGMPEYTDLSGLNKYKIIWNSEKYRLDIFDRSDAMYMGSCVTEVIKRQKTYIKSKFSHYYSSWQQNRQIQGKNYRGTIYLELKED